MVVMAPGGRRAEADVLAEAVVLVGCEGRVEPSINHKVGSTVQTNTNNQPAKNTPVVSRHATPEPAARDADAGGGRGEGEEVGQDGEQAGDVLQERIRQGLQRGEAPGCHI